MYKVFINASDRYKKLVQLRKYSTSEDFEIIGFKEGEIDIVASVREVLREAGLSVNDVKDFVSFPGPGSFTGLKISATIANVLNWSLGKRSIRELEYPDYGREPNITPRKEI